MLYKRLLLVSLAILSILFTTAQQKKTYDEAWRNIDDLIQKKGQTQSALKEVDKLYEQAKKEQNDAQVIKALIYKVELAQTWEPDAAKKNILLLEKEIPLAKEPAKSVLKSMAAQYYYQYYIVNRYRTINRTTTVNFNKEDIATWNVDDFLKKIAELYSASIANEKLLQETKLEPLNPILNLGNTRNLRPTLYDFLVHRAINYFSNEEYAINKPSYTFEIDNPVAFADIPEFIAFHFTTQDSLSLHFHALKLLQDLLRFHLHDAHPDALIDNNIERIEFVNGYGVMEEKEQLYKKALEQVTNKYLGLPVAAQAWYLQAKIYYDKAVGYDPIKDTLGHFDYLPAKEICEKVLQEKDSSEGRANCFNLLKLITRKEITVATEKVNVPAQPFRMLLQYRNVGRIYFRILRTDVATRKFLAENVNSEQYWEKIMKLPVIKSFDQVLPGTKDYQQHRAEMKVDALPAGEYAILTSLSSDFSIKENILLFQSLFVSNISYINNGFEYYVLNRETGQPIVRANVQVWYQVYNSNTSRYSERQGENILTDKNGYFKIFPSKTGSENYYKLDITAPGDRLFLDEFAYHYNSLETPPPQPEHKIVVFFTDRSIYRPGQTVYFKGIVISRSGAYKPTAIVPQFTSTVYLSDANREKIDSLTLTTNEFGSYSGKFTLPVNLLNGQFRLIDKVTFDEGQPFSVEEYKRPRFQVSIQEPSGTYKLNDSIKVTGTAKAYAGNNIDGATVKYTVTRRTFIPYWGRYTRYNRYPSSGSVIEIAHGTTVTKSNGEFVVPFKAIPDRAIPKESLPDFMYTVSVDITDINGETRSGSTIVTVGYRALQLSIVLDNKLHTDSLKNIKITSKNSNELFEKASVTLNIYKLKIPSRVFRERLWEQPDQLLMSKDEYYKFFPHDVYQDENEPTTWPVEEKVIGMTDSTKANGYWDIGNKSLAAGWYKVEALAKDKYGQDVKTESYVQLYNKDIISPLAFGSIENDRITAEPGDNIHYQVSTNLDSVYIIRELQEIDSVSKRDLITLNKKSQSFDFPVTEKNRGGFGIRIMFVKDNRVYTDNELYYIPYSNKELKISYETYRDKTIPGSEEKWKVNITGKKGEKVAAQLLTAMYDASLDQFVSHIWQNPFLWPSFYSKGYWDVNSNFSTTTSWPGVEDYVVETFDKSYDVLIGDNSNTQRHMKIPNRFGNFQHDMNLDLRLEYKSAAPIQVRGTSSLAMERQDNFGVMGGMAAVRQVPDWSKDPDGSKGIMKDTFISSQNPESLENLGIPGTPVAARKNFNETAFFFPELSIDSAGNVSFSFTMPEAVTQWRWMNLAYTKDLKFGFSEKSIITQKEMMVQPNAPRFLREGDRMDFSGKIVNMSEKEITGQVQLLLIDPTTNQSVDGWFHNMYPNQYFTVAAGQSTPVNFSIEVPFQYNRPVTYKLVARTDSSASGGPLSDGEENILPVVSNRMLVTESMPISMHGNTTKDFKFQKLLQSGKSETLSQHALTIEYTSNPAWYAVQALPYLIEYPYECAEQTFNRYYANALATLIANSSPRIKEIFERWKTTDTSALLSNLQKNEELKAVLLQETPWVLDAKNESQQKKNIALLFDMVRMSQSLNSALNKLQQMQNPGGGFVWFKGGPDDRYMTQYILTGIGHLKKLNALPKGNTINNIVNIGIAYLDKKIKEDYDDLVRRKIDLSKNNLSYLAVQYLYMRSFFTGNVISGNNSTAYNYFRKQAQQYWLSQNKYLQGMIALSLQRTGDAQTAKNIITSLQQNAVTSDELGMYWKEMTGGYYWYQAPIETESLLIEAFTEVTNDSKAVEGMKTWLLKQKQTQNWGTTKATSDACYALLLQGTDWLSNTPQVTIKLGSLTVRSSDQQQEAGTGYFKKVIDGSFVNPGMGDIQVSVMSQNPQAAPSPSWGAVYWQYFEDLDKITPAETPLKLNRKLFVEKNTDRGPVLQPINAGDALKVGDKVKVRIELRVDRTMEYVHMKDMRAACMEPVNVLSQYKYQDGLGYYESTKDASTNFFFSYLPKGTYVFEYPLFITHTGTFSNGITSIQCMYAPEFNSHSEGIKVTVE